MDRDEILTSLSQELRRGTLVLCVLCCLGKPTYGYSLIGKLGDSGMPIEANTLYPLLRRLESQGILESTWDTEGAKPRKYYSTTDFGKEILLELQAQWHATEHSLNALMEEYDYEA